MYFRHGPPRFDINYKGDLAWIDHHHCREFDAEGVGCFGTNPDHGCTFDEAKALMIEHYTLVLSKWEAMTYEQWQRPFNGEFD
jgi:hypothetical protein